MGSWKFQGRSDVSVEIVKLGLKNPGNPVPKVAISSRTQMHFETEVFG